PVRRSLPGRLHLHGLELRHQYVLARRLRGRLREAAAGSGVGAGQLEPDRGAGIEAREPAGLDESGPARRRWERDAIMNDLVLFILIFLAAGLAVLGGHLFLGKLVRPHRPSPEKGAVYECGEPTIGSAWIQFDLRFYVVALLFVIFDVELAFFFPWAVVFGSAHRAADATVSVEQQRLAAEAIQPLGAASSTAAIDAGAMNE